MRRNRLGKSSIVVSEICMGTMTFGNQADEKTAFRIMDMAFEAGVDFFDTAEMYPVPPDAKYVGATEEIVGRWMKTRDRDSLIIATKVAGPSHIWIQAPLRGGKTGLDRHHIMRAVEASLRRLNTDYIDLYQTHWPDQYFPYEETMMGSFPPLFTFQDEDRVLFLLHRYNTIICSLRSCRAMHTQVNPAAAQVGRCRCKGTFGLWYLRI